MRSHRRLNITWVPKASLMVARPFDLEMAVIAADNVNWSAAAVLGKCSAGTKIPVAVADRRFRAFAGLRLHY